jgi:GAF domain-containing protein
MMEEKEIRRRLDSVTAELLSTYEELDVLSTVAEIAGSTADITVAGQQILDEAMTLLDVDTAFVAYTDPEIEGREPPPRGVSPEERDAIVEAVGGRLKETSRPVLLAPFTEGSAIPHAPDAVLAVPLRFEDQMLGVICLGRRGEGATFAAGDLKVMSVLGSSAASVVLQRKNLDLSRLTHQLEERNMLLQGLLAVSRELASSLDLDRLLHALSSLPARALGFDRCAVLLDDGATRRIRSRDRVAREVPGVGRGPGLTGPGRGIAWGRGLGGIRRRPDGRPGRSGREGTFPHGSLRNPILAGDSSERRPGNARSALLRKRECVVH